MKEKYKRALEKILSELRHIELTDLTKAEKNIRAIALNALDNQD